MDGYDKTEKLEVLTEQNKELKQEVEKLRRFNISLLRQVKERSNVSKGQFPKKKHTGYSLVSSMIKEYRYYKSGNHKTVWIFETVLQTPYDISIEHDDVLELISDDLYEQDDDDKSILDKLGFTDLYDDKAYADFYEGNNIRDMIDELVSNYKEKNDTSYIPDEVYKKIRDYSEKMVRKACYNLNARMNGRDSYWELSINHIEPLASIPPELRFPVKKKRKKNGDSKEKED